MPRPEIRKAINIKRVIYRSVTLFVSDLGQLHSCSDTNINFDVLEKLLEIDVLDNRAFHDLSSAVAVACLTRLYQYMKIQAQDDSVSEYSPLFFLVPKN